MTRLRGDMVSPQSLLLLTAAAAILTVSSAGPLPNTTSVDLGLKEGSCALGDVVYMHGDEFQGSGPCERCRCSAGDVSCARMVCEPRAGCKALHRPDHCCPTYQCECEQEGRVYGNGEKLVDPADPCRVCYCQGGEVVCRRIACFLRDDCRPRHVPGRCCPEYDNCPLRGVTAIPGLSQNFTGIVPIEDVGISPEPTKPKEVVKQQITIKEITPVSEIPVITEVKIKEILPSTNIDIAEYPSSKAPLITREATSEKTIVEVTAKTEVPTVVEVQPSPTPGIVSSTSYSSTSTKQNTASYEIKLTSEALPSNTPTQESGKSETTGLHTSTTAAPSVPPLVVVSSSTKAPAMEEEDQSIFEHNPAFPPLPDDFSVLGNHEDEIVQDNDGEHISPSHDPVTVTSSPLTDIVFIPTNSITIPSSLKTPEPTLVVVQSSTAAKTEDTIKVDLTTVKEEFTLTTEAITIKESPMLNLRSAIPTEILNVPSLVPEDITGELDEITEVPLTTASPIDNTVFTSIEDIKTTVNPIIIKNTAPVVTTSKAIETTQFPTTVRNLETPKPSSEVPPSLASEVTSQTELSSLPIETSDQNPQESLINMAKEQNISPSTKTKNEEYTTKQIQFTPELITTVDPVTTSPLAELTSIEDAETTEFVLTSFGSSEITTDGVELIKVSTATEKSAPFIQNHGPRNVLKELINLVGDVASINDHTDEPEVPQKGISESEELLPVNAGYKSKNSNWNINSITEIPVKSKSTVGNKQKVVEIEGEDTDSIIDASPPNDKVEPTTRKPVIDNVSDTMAMNKTDKKDIEIISQSYVPTINKRPTKVVMKKKIDRTTTVPPGSVPDVPPSQSPYTSAVPLTTIAVKPVPSASPSPSTGAILSETSPASL